MLVLTVLTGVVDAVSILSLGRVFVANMTGNVVFVGFALAGAPGFSLAASLSALGGFLVGAGTGGVAVDRLGSHRGRLVIAMAAAELALVLAALLLAALARPALQRSRDGRNRGAVGAGDGHTERRRAPTQGLRSDDNGPHDDADRHRRRHPSARPLRHHPSRF